MADYYRHKDHLAPNVLHLQIPGSPLGHQRLWTHVRMDCNEDDLRTYIIGERILSMNAMNEHNATSSKKINSLHHSQMETCRALAPSRRCG